MSEKNRPPGDRLGGPKSLLEAKKSLAELKIEGSKALLVPHARNLVIFYRKIYIFNSFLKIFIGSLRDVGRSLRIEAIP